jgi:transcriptional regulator
MSQSKVILSSLTSEDLCELDESLLDKTLSELNIEILTSWDKSTKQKEINKALNQKRDNINNSNDSIHEIEHLIDEVCNILS